MLALTPRSCKTKLACYETAYRHAFLDSDWDETFVFCGFRVFRVRKSQKAPSNIEISSLEIGRLVL